MTAPKGSYAPLAGTESPTDVDDELDKNHGAPQRRNPTRSVRILVLAATVIGLAIVHMPECKHHAKNLTVVTSSESISSSSKDTQVTTRDTPPGWGPVDPVRLPSTPLQEEPYHKDPSLRGRTSGIKPSRWWWADSSDSSDENSPDAVKVDSSDSSDSSDWWSAVRGIFQDSSDSSDSSDSDSPDAIQVDSSDSSDSNSSDSPKDKVNPSSSDSSDSSDWWDKIQGWWKDSSDESKDSSDETNAEDTAAIMAVSSTMTSEKMTMP